MLEPMLFNVLTNGMDKGIECTLSNFADDTHPSGAVDRPEGQGAIQMDLDMLQKWAHENLMTFSKCKTLYLGQSLVSVQVGDKCMESRPVEKNLAWMKSWM